MKTFYSTLLVSVLLFSGCATKPKKEPEPPLASKTGDGKSVIASKAGDQKRVVADDDSFEDIPPVVVSDPLEALNRATFLLNHGIYTVILRPVSKGYKWAVPKLVRDGIHNAYENVTTPVRFTNHALQGKFDRAGKELGKFAVNSVVGVGGVWQPSQKIPMLANVPRADTGQTFAKWKIGNGPYMVLPLIGPSTLRDSIGIAGDAVLNPVNWVSFIFGGAAWTVAISTPDTVRSLPARMDQYDAATKDALDRYLAARTSYIQYRKAFAER